MHDCLILKSEVLLGNFYIRYQSGVSRVNKLMQKQEYIHSIFSIAYIVCQLVLVYKCYYITASFDLIFINVKPLNKMM